MRERNGILQVKVRNDASIFTRSDIYPEIKKYFAYNDHRTSDYLKHATLKSLIRFILALSPPWCSRSILFRAASLSFDRVPLHVRDNPKAVHSRNLARVLLLSCSLALSSFSRLSLVFLPSFFRLSPVFLPSVSRLSPDLSRVCAFWHLSRFSSASLPFFRRRGSWLDRVPLPGHALPIHSIFSFA